MLQTQAIEPNTLELLKSLQNKTYLKGFNLAEGTALALFIEHRISIDVDLISNFNFDTAQLIEQIQQDYSLQLYYTSSNTVRGSIENINIDIIAYRYPYLIEPSLLENIQILSIPDIIAMKLNAIATRGQRSKDFVDIYFILENSVHSLSDMVKFTRPSINRKMICMC